MTELDLHIGIHKTATTHIQNILHRSKFSTDTHYIPLMKFRQWIGRDILFGKLENIPDSIYQHKHLVISDENLCGLAKGGLKMYPKLQRYLSHFESFHGRVHICLRKYSEFIPSAWIESTRKGRVLPFPDEIPERSYIDILSDIESVLPNFEIKVWDFDDFKMDQEFYIKQITNFKVERLGEIASKASRQSPSASALQAFLSMAEFLSARQRSIALGKLMKQFPVSEKYAKFNPFDKDEAKILDDRYQAELREIDNRYGLVKPPL